MDPIEKQRRLLFLLSSLLWLAVFFQGEQPERLKVIIDNSSIKENPEIGGKTLLGIPLGTVLRALAKEGEWYRVAFEQDGKKVTGYIHEMLVKVIPSEQDKAIASRQAGSEESEAALITQIELEIEENKILIREENDLTKAIEGLSPLIAKVFRVSDFNKQKELAREIFLWLGLAHARLGSEYSAFKQFKNVFEVDYEYGRMSARNILDPETAKIIDQAGRDFLGAISGYSLEISTEPEGATVKINNTTVGLSPQIYTSQTPLLEIEIEKDGYKTVKEKIFLKEPESKRSFTLKSIGRAVRIVSHPPGAEISLDGELIDEKTDCLLPPIPLGKHHIKLVKRNYVDWEREISIDDGEGAVEIRASMIGKDYGFSFKWGDDPQSLRNPSRIAMGKQGYIYLIDTSSRKIHKFTAKGEPIDSWNTAKKEINKIKRPSDVAVDNEGYIYITDTNSNAVMKYDPSGKLVLKWGGEGDGPEDLRNPSGIAIDKNNDVYIADTLNHRIKKYSSSGDLIKVFGKRGDLEGEFFFPVNIAINQHNEIYALDRRKVQKFSSDGEFILSWGNIGSRSGEFNSPSGIDIDNSNCVYVADKGNHRIQKFSPGGDFISLWGRVVGSKDGQMLYPSDVAVDSGGAVYIVDRDNHCVQVFVVVSTQPEDSTP